MPTVMQLENVYRIYRMGQEVIHAVDGVSMSVNEGEILCLQGPSGSGKSTLLHMMAGLDRPSKGSIYLGKTPIEKLSEDSLALFRQRHVGFIFQSYYLIPTLTAIENVTLPLMFAGVSASKRNKVAKELLAAVGLKERMKHKPSQMSGGQQQRVSIARAFANDPKIVFADEPTGNLDTHTTFEMMNLMTQLARERRQTLIIVTHDLEISGYATRLVKVRDGKIEGDEEGPVHHASHASPPIHLTAEVDGSGDEESSSGTAPPGGSGEVRAVNGNPSDAVTTVVDADTAFAANHGTPGWTIGASSGTEPAPAAMDGIPAATSETPAMTSGTPTKQETTAAKAQKKNRGIFWKGKGQGK